MKPQKIRALLIENKITQTSIARELNLKPSSINRVIDRHYKSRRVQEAIASKVGVPFEKMWANGA